MDISYDTKEWDQVQQKAISKSGKAPIIEFAGRKIVVREINGVKVPFYLSTGSGGKKTVPAGKWYPFFGINANEGWINKGPSSDIVNYYGIDELKRQAEELDQTIGDIRNRTDIPKVSTKGRHMSLINSDPDWGIENGRPDTTQKIRKNIEGLKSKIAQGQSAGQQAGSVKRPINVNALLNPPTAARALTPESATSPTLTSQMTTPSNPGLPNTALPREPGLPNTASYRAGRAVRTGLGGFMRGLGSLTQLGRNSTTMESLTDLQRGMFGGGAKSGLAFRNLGRAGIVAGTVYGGMKLADLIGGNGSKPTGETGQNSVTPDVTDYRKKATKNVLGRLTFDDKNTFTKDDMKYYMSQQDSKVTSAISNLRKGESGQAFIDTLKQVVQGGASASTLNNMIVKAMGPDAKSSKGPIYLPGTYKLGDKSYMMAIDNTEENAPRLVRMAVGGKELEFDPYKPQQAK